jgi:hypothetical protein
MGVVRDTVPRWKGMGENQRIYISGFEVRIFSRIFFLEQELASVY